MCRRDCRPGKCRYIRFRSKSALRWPSARTRPTRSRVRRGTPLHWEVGKDSSPCTRPELCRLRPLRKRRTRRMHRNARTPRRTARCSTCLPRNSRWRSRPATHSLGPGRTDTRSARILCSRRTRIGRRCRTQRLTSDSCPRSNASCRSGRSSTTPTRTRSDGRSLRRYACARVRPSRPFRTVLRSNLRRSPKHRRSSRRSHRVHPFRRSMCSRRRNYSSCPFHPSRSTRASRVPWWHRFRRRRADLR